MKSLSILGIITSFLGLSLSSYILVIGHGHKMLVYGVEEWITKEFEFLDNYKNITTNIIYVLIVFFLFHLSFSIVACVKAFKKNPQ